jgi:hypothetical protein
MHHTAIPKPFRINGYGIYNDLHVFLRGFGIIPNHSDEDLP